MRRFGSLDLSTRAYVVGVIAVGALVVFPFGWTLQPIHDPAVVLELVYLGIGTQVACLMPIRWAHSFQVVYTPLLVAAALVAPGPGVAVLIWFATFDGRIPGRTITWWAFLFNRAMLTIAYGVPSLVLLAIPTGGAFWMLWSLPIKTLLLTLALFCINFPLTARVVGHLSGKSTVQALIENVGLTTFQSSIIMGSVGGLLYLVLKLDVGYIMALALFGILVSVRSNMADAQRQGEERLQTLHLAAQALDARDKFTESHSERVAELAAALGEAMGLTGRRLEELRSAGSLHDLGKIGIRDVVLNKPGALTEEEWSLMKEHPVIGADMIQRHSALRSLVPMVRGHHERWNGSGYPDGLRGHNIPVGARILAVADSFDTITSPRQYRPSTMSPLEAVEDISRRAAVWYDPAVVDALRELHQVEPIGEGRHAEQQPFASPGALRIIAQRPRFAQLLAGMTISSLGDPMTTVATLVALFALTHDPRTVAAAYAVKAVATVLIGIFATSIPDVVNRQRLIVILEFARAGLLVVTPLLISMVSLWLVFPVLFVLAAVNGLIQPARQAALADVVEPREVGAANAGLAAAGMIAMACGYALAAVVLLVGQSTAWLFVLDGLTFVFAGLTVIGLGNLGGGVQKVSHFRGIGRTWANQEARVHLAIAGVGSFFLSMSFPTLITLAYRRAPEFGATAYTVLEVMLAVGIVVGSVLVGRMRGIGSMRTAAQGLAIVGLFSVAVAVSPWLWLVAVFILLASLGNPLYSVGNVTALMDVSDSSNRGTIMSSRFAITQLALILGTTAGGFVSGVIGPEATYGLLGFGLLGVAAVVAVLSRERRVVGEAAP